jgi:signal transduction histidine kinase
MMHDMGTPLTVINSHIELLLMKSDRNDLVKRLETMKNQVQYCADLSRSTMNFLRQGQAGAAPNKLNDVMTTCLKVAAPLMREMRAKLIANLSEQSATAVFEPVLMRQVVMNVITNGCQAMASQETERVLYVETFTESGHACIAIEDTGPGVPEKIRETIFETFFSTKGQGGTGLGLGVVRNVMRRFGGSVKIEPGKHGTGARFVMRLPVA